MSDSVRKTALIEKKIAGTATEAELRELEWLKLLAEDEAERIAPLPLAQLDAVKEQLVAKGQWKGEP